MLIKVKVIPNSQKEEISKETNERYIIKVKEHPQNNEANKRVIKILSEYFNVPPFKIKIKTGHKKRNKTIEIETDTK